MDSELVLLGVFGVIIIALEGFFWGLFGYVLFKIFKINDKFWVIGALVTGLLYFLWDEIVVNQMIAKLSIQTTNEKVSRFLGDDWLSIDITDLIFYLIATIIGFKISQKIIEKLVRNWLDNSIKKDEITPVNKM